MVDVRTISANCYKFVTLFMMPSDPVKSHFAWILRNPSLFYIFSGSILSLVEFWIPNITSKADIHQLQKKISIVWISVFLFCASIELSKVQVP